jgi:hypothetical protein
MCVLDTLLCSVASAVYYDTLQYGTIHSICIAFQTAIALFQTIRRNLDNGYIRARRFIIIPGKSIGCSVNENGVSCEKTGYYYSFTANSVVKRNVVDKVNLRARKPSQTPQSSESSSIKKQCNDNYIPFSQAS